MATATASPMSASRRPLLGRVERPDWAAQAHLSGVGLEVFRREQGDVLTVAAVHPGSAAQRAGIVPGNRITFLDGLDASLMTLDQAKGMLMGAPMTTVKVEVSTAPLPPGTRTLELVRGEGQALKPPPKHDFHRQKRPVPHDSLVGMLSASAAPADAPDAHPSAAPSEIDTNMQQDYEGKIQKLTAQLQREMQRGREYCGEIDGLAAQLEAAIRENAVLRGKLEMPSTAALDAREREELMLAREMLLVDHSAMLRDLKSTNAQQRNEMEELRDYIDTQEAQIQPLTDELNLLKGLQREQNTALERIQSENRRLKEELEALRLRPRSVERPAEVTPLVRGGETEDSLRLLLEQANAAMQTMEDEQKRMQSEFERSKFHEQVAADRQALLLARDRQLMEAQAREEELRMKLLDMERQLKGMRDGAINVKQRNADTNQMVESLQQQLEQMQLLALSQSREAEAAMIAMGSLKDIEMQQTNEILRLNAIVAELEKHQKIQDQRADATAERWKLKRDQLVDDLDKAKKDIMQRDEVINKHRLLIREYQSVLEVVKKAGGAMKAFKHVSEKGDKA